MKTHFLSSKRRKTVAILAAILKKKITIRKNERHKTTVITTPIWQNLIHRLQRYMFFCCFIHSVFTALGATSFFNLHANLQLCWANKTSKIPTSNSHISASPWPISKIQSVPIFFWLGLCRNHYHWSPGQSFKNHLNTLAKAGQVSSTRQSQCNTLILSDLVLLGRIDRILDFLILIYQFISECNL